MAFQTSISVYEGTKFTVTMTMVPPENVTGWAVGFGIREGSNGAALFVSKSIGAGVEVLDLVNGVFRATVEAAETAGRPRACIYAFERTDPGEEDVLAIGTLRLLRKVL